jgi:hypothetical protein
MVEPPKPKPKGRPPVHTVPRAAAAIKVDGKISPAEWGGADPKKAMVLKQDVHGAKAAPRSLAWLACDDACLLVAIENTVSKAPPLKRGNRWGQDDAVEIAAQNPAAGKKAPILVLRGYTNGKFESSDEAGAPAEAVKRAAQGVQYAAKVVDAARWTAEWRIPFKSLGIDPAKHGKIRFNLTVRKSAQPLWLMWEGTRGYSWRVGQAGLLELAK